jgi:hypothetical protein
MENWDKLPQEVQAVLFQCEEYVTYEKCECIISSLEAIGWTADFDLSAQIFDIKKKSL